MTTKDLGGIDKLINEKGAYVAAAAGFRGWISADGSTEFKAEPGRYHVYASLACPFTHRVLLMRTLKGLEDVIGVIFADWFVDKANAKTWTFTDKVDTVNGCSSIEEVYLKAVPGKVQYVIPQAYRSSIIGYNGRTSVPCVWDKKTSTIVNNESSDIIRMLNTEFNEFCRTEEQKNLDFYPESLRQEIDKLNSWIHADINMGVYKCGFARSQEAYDEAVTVVFKALDKVEEILSTRRYLTGDKMTEADLRLFPTLVRFDEVYHGLFKCNKKRIIDYPNLWGYLRDMYQTKGIGDTVDMEHIKKHYMVSMVMVNPFGIVSVGPNLDFNTPHNRMDVKT